MNDSESVSENKDTGKVIKNISKSSNKIRNMVYIAMMTAVMSLLAQVSFQLPTGVPITLQTFAVALIAAITGWKLGTASTALYLAIGTIGVPVFAGAQAGPGVVAGPAGGFLWGFLFMVVLCGLGSSMCKGKAVKGYVIGYILGFAGLAICHICGIVQFMFVADKPFAQAFVLVSAPYIIKDVVSVVLAYIVGGVIRGRLVKAGLI
jgi:biotin transport system substrate-specific component